MRAASEEYTRVIISRESRESHKILLYAFGGIGVICVSKKPRTLHATSLLSPLIAQKSVSYVLMSNPFGGIGAICVSENLGRCTQTSLRFLFSCLLSSRHAELVSASHREPFLVLLRGQILKRVQDDICVLTAHRSLLKTQKLVLLFFCQKSKSAVICRICVISVPLKNSLQNRIFV